MGVIISGLVKMQKYQTFSLTLQGQYMCSAPGLSKIYR